ncbi:hypothetical protein E1B28_001899 [Marasmius oreades]|uniref:AAA-ATPase-like domain-containing protein n=1 Tax=Marasmius oreades TaxID=181124 RepID=A0A9P7V4C0_9AGAR|nr:uncharacterized protein E1B28_001899 [Marasmius oreades]KAG7100119.1 hypothetical protein E1B28_001899 [Marasmius oreades]
MVDILSEHHIVLLIGPPGQGKTSTISIIGQLYDISRKEEFADTFCTTLIGRCGKPLVHSNKLVLSLDLKGVTQNNYNQVLNAQMEEFVAKYQTALNLEHNRILIGSEATDTVNNIMVALSDACIWHSLVVTIDNYDSPFFDPDLTKPTYDKMKSNLAKLLYLLEMWTNTDGISVMFLAGRTDLGWVGCPKMAYNIVIRNTLDHFDDPREVELCGLTRQEIRDVTSGLSSQFPSLGLEGLRDEFLETVGKEEYRVVGKYHGYPCRAVLDWLHDWLKEHAAHILG